MKRRALYILLLLVAGAIVNVAVAWAIMLMTSNSSFEQMYPERGDDLHWPKGMPKEWPDPGFGEFGYASGFRYESYSRLELHEESNEEWDGLRLETGWPTFGMLSLWHSHSLSTDESSPTETWVGGIAVPDNDPPWNWPPRILPLRPLWPGFAINTVFYAFIVWLLFAGPFALRRLRGGRRINRGLCTKCAYPVGTNQVCTECGAAVPGRASAR